MSLGKKQCFVHKSSIRLDSDPRKPWLQGSEYHVRRLTAWTKLPWGAAQWGHRGVETWPSNDGSGQQDFLGEAEAKVQNLPPLELYSNDQLPTDSGTMSLWLHVNTKEDFGNRSTGFYSFAKASSSLFIFFFFFFWDESPTTKEQHHSPELGARVAHAAWVDLRTQATGSALTATVGANNEGPVYQPCIHASHQWRKKDRCQVLNTRQMLEEGSGQKEGMETHGRRKYVKSRNF